MLSTLILYLTQKFETFTYLQKVYGLGLEREVNESKFISVIEGNTEQHLNLDTHLSCCVFLKNGNKSVEQVESPTVANEYLVKHTYPFKCLVYAKIAESANCESESQKIADSIEKSITGRQKAILTSTQLDNAYIEIKNTNYEKHSIYSGYYSVGGLGDNDILIEIEFDFIVEGNQNCFVDSPCAEDDFVFDFDAPETFCERVDTCLDIPTEDGEYVLTITNGVKTWTEFSPSGLTNGNGTVINGTKVDLGGSLLQDTTTEADGFDSILEDTPANIKVGIYDNPASLNKAWNVEHSDNGVNFLFSNKFENIPINVIDADGLSMLSYKDNDSERAFSGVMKNRANGDLFDFALWLNSTATSIYTRSLDKDGFSVSGTNNYRLFNVGNDGMTRYHNGNAVNQFDNSGFMYIGSESVDGSWRFATSSGNLVIQKRESGNWVTKQTFI